LYPLEYQTMSVRQALFGFKKLGGEESGLSKTF
jgi:hypothetical protein